MGSGMPPESFSYTLSETWAAGRAVLVPPIGALAERVAGHEAGWIMTQGEWRDESLILDRLLDLLSPYHAVAIENAGARAARMPVATLDGMIDATRDVYERAVAGSRVPPLPIDRRRIAEAFGYRPWIPPPRATAEASPAATPEPRPLTRTAIRFRHSPVGRLLYRLMPPRAVDALRARLR